MKTLTAFLSVLALLAGMIFISGAAVSAQTCDSTRAGFVDMNGDGFNDNAPDHDGDGIPNGQDPDWTRNPQDGTGYMHKNMNGKAVQTQNKGEDKPGVQNREQKKQGSAVGAGNQYQNQNKNKQENGTLTRTQTKAQLKQQFQSKAQAFTRTQTMSQVRQQLRDGSCGDGTANGGAGSGNGSGNGVCDGTGPKGSGKGGNK
jgi:hypothetical protein